MAYFDVRRDCVLHLENLANWDLWPLVDRSVTWSQKQIISSSESSFSPLSKDSCPSLSTR